MNFDSGIYLYNNDFTEKNEISNIYLSSLEKINIIKHIFNNKIYIFCLINNNLYFYDYSKSYFQNFNSIVDWYMIDYVNIIPFNTYSTKGNKLKLIKTLIDCDYYDYYFICTYYDVIFKNNLQNYELTIQHEQKKEVSFGFCFKKNLCHLLESNILKCIYCSDTNFINLEYNIETKTIKYSFYNAGVYFVEIVSSKSHNDNYLICPLLSQRMNGIYYNYTKCYLCNKEKDFGSTRSINNSYTEDCSKVRTYYFNETNKYGVICQRFNEFIFLIINNQNIKVEKRKVIYFNCDNFRGYNGEFSMIYNNSLGDYNIITDYNFTKNPTCSLEIKDEMNFQEKNYTGTEKEKKEIIKDNNQITSTYISSDESFSDFREFSYYSDYVNTTISKSEENTGYFTDDISNEKELTNEINDTKVQKSYDNIPDSSDDINNEQHTTNEKIATTNLVDSTQLIINTSNIYIETKESSYFYIQKYTDYTTTPIAEKTDIKPIEEIITIKEETINKTMDDLLKNITEVLSNVEIGKNYEIKGDDFTIIIKPTNSPPLPNKTHVEFNECEQILRTVNNISNSSIITFFQMEINSDNKDALYDQIQYTIYDDKLKELDLTACKDVTTQIHYAIKDKSNLDIVKVNDYKNMGVDILNINDDFFTNLCYAFSSSNNDMILEDRIKYIFQNYSLCEEGCSYNNLDIVTRSITCDCKIQGNISAVTTPLTFDTGKETSFFDSNIGVSRCYNLVFSLNNRSDNLGFIIFCFLILIYFIAIIVQIKKGIKKVSDFLYNEMIKYGYIEQDHRKFFELKRNENCKAELSSVIGIKKFKEKAGDGLIDTDKKTNKKSKKKKSKKKKKINAIKITQRTTSIGEKDNMKSFNSRTKILRKKTKKIIQDDDYDDNNFGIIKINVDLEIKKYYPKDSNQSLLNYTFEEAARYDKRNICRIFYIYLLSKQIIFRTFLQKSPLELFPLRLTLFIFMLSCDFALNALFYFNDNISKKYHYASNIFLFALSNNITIIIYSTLVSYFILTLLSKLSNSSSAIRNIFRIEEEKLKKKKKYVIKEQTKENIFNEVEGVLKNFKCKIFFLLLIETIFILLFWYFVTAFCSVYSSTQTSWALDTFLSILSRLILEIIFGFLFAKLYRISVASSCETLYKLLICIYDFS